MSRETRTTGTDSPEARGSAPARWVLACALLLCVSVPFLLWQDRLSLQRGNRLYRSGDPTGAAEVYRQQDGENRVGPTQYNLGTALLEAHPDSAEGHLRYAIEADDPAAAQRSFYNLGYRYLTAGGGPMRPDSTIAALAGAIVNNRAALRLAPDDEAARWNLALSQRLLNAMVPPDEQAEREGGGDGDEELAIDDQSLSRSETADAVSGLEPEDPRPANNTGERQGAEEGAREAWASQDPGPMTRGAAVDLLEVVEDEAESLIRGILWSHRPDIAWWESQPYPGGAW